MYSKEQLENIKTQTDVIMATQEYCHNGVKLNKLWHEIINGLCDQLLSKDFADVIGVFEPSHEEIIKESYVQYPKNDNDDIEAVIEKSCKRLGFNDGIQWILKRIKEAQK